QRRLERRIECHITGAVYDDVGVAHYPFRVFFNEPEQLVAYVAVDRHDLAFDEFLKPVTVFFSQRIERRRRHDTGPKTNVRFLLIARADRRVHLPDVGEIMKQHRQRHLAHKACAADEEDLLTLEYFGW